MSKDYDLKKEWERAKKQLIAFSKEATVLAKKGEKELAKISKKGKLQIDSSAAALKKEHLFYLIGREYIKAKCPGKKSAKMKKLVLDLEKINTEIKSISKKMKNVK